MALLLLGRAVRAAGGKETPAPPDRSPSHPEPSRHRCGLDRLCLDRLGLTQAIGGGVLGLMALFSSYDHISFAGRSIPIPQQWGIPLIAASVAIIFIDLRMKQLRSESLERLHQGALLSARVQRDPTDTNRARLRTFLALIAGGGSADQG